MARHGRLWRTGDTKRTREGGAWLAWHGEVRRGKGKGAYGAIFFGERTMEQRKYGFTLTGLTPLIMHWDNLEWADQIKAKRTEIKEKDKKNFEAGDDRCPPDTWKGYLYNDGNLVALPTDNLRAALCKAGARITLKRQTTYKALTQSGLLFPDLFLPLSFSGKTITMKTIGGINGTFAEQCAQARAAGFELFAKRASVGQAKHVRVRPRFLKWSCSGEVLVIDDQISEDTLHQLFEIMGLSIGLCDWRPGSPKSPGPYGKCEASWAA